LEIKLPISILEQTFMKKKTTHPDNQRKHSSHKPSGKDKTSQEKRLTEKKGFISTRRMWLFRLFLVFVLPLIILLVLELGLRVIGVGYPTSIAVPCTVKDEDYYCNNTKFGWSFFPKRISRQTEPFMFPLEKEKNNYRIFILGGSAAQGTPDGAYSFGRMLDVMLRKTYPEVGFEVITVAMPAINSHVVYQIAQDCLEYEPNLFVVYMGNNEVLGPYGAGTMFSPISSHLRLIRGGVFLKSSRLVQVITGLSEGMKKKGESQSWRGLEMFLEKQVRKDDMLQAKVYRHFQRNLEDIIAGAGRKQVPLILCTVGSNLRDCPPFASLHSQVLSEDEQKKFGEFFAQGKQAESDKDFELALRKYQEALSIDNGFAEAHFRAGQCYWSRGEYNEAKNSYVLSRDYDTLRFRADSQINKIIEEIGIEYEGKGVYFVDTKKVFAENSLRGITGKELFYEHVHMTFKGNYLLGRAVFLQLEKILPESIRGKKNSNVKRVSEVECKQSLGYTKWERYKIYDKVLNSFIKQPPFTNQAYQSRRVRYLSDKVKSYKKALTTEAIKEIAVQYHQAIRENPSDWWLYWKYADFLTDNNADPTVIIMYYKQIEEMMPHYAQVYERLGSCQGKMGRLDEALQNCRKSVELNPFHSYARFHLGLAYQLKGNVEKAIEHYRVAVELAPENGPAWNNLGTILYKNKNVDKAIETYRKGLQYVKDFSDLNYNLAILLHEKGNRLEAIKELEAGLEIDPNSVKIRKFLRGLRQE
jgi:tetratricopeptide (TPR) repeat protein